MLFLFPWKFAVFSVIWWFYRKICKIDYFWTVYMRKPVKKQCMGRMGFYIKKLWHIVIIFLWQVQYFPLYLTTRTATKWVLKWDVLACLSIFLIATSFGDFIYISLLVSFSLSIQLFCFLFLSCTFYDSWKGWTHL